MLDSPKRCLWEEWLHNYGVLMTDELPLSAPLEVSVSFQALEWSQNRRGPNTFEERRRAGVV